MINIFYHQHSLNDYKERFDRTYSKIQKYDLSERTRHMFVSSDCKVQHVAYDGYILPIFYDRFVSEQKTLSYLHTLSKEHDGYSLYLHSKGVSHPTSPNVQDWIDLMEYFLIEKHEECIKSLDEGYDLVGVNYMERPERHFSGNFWWANNRYLRTLPDIHPTDRVRCEMWVCSNPDAKIKCLHNSPVNHYHDRYPRTIYAN